MKKTAFFLTLLVITFLIIYFNINSTNNKKVSLNSNATFENKSFINAVKPLTDDEENVEKIYLKEQDNKNNSPKENNNEEKNNLNIDDWKLVLVNYENALPENFEIELANIDKTRKFDSRAISYLNDMLKAMRKDGIENVWVQSAYRSIEYQKGLYNDKINSYIKLGKTREEAEKLTLEKINRPGTSEHNLGLSVDFNYVDYTFDETKGFKWLQENAENYGFILRYKKEKEDITKIDYEPWHWRFVGLENAKKMNELDMCLEEYIEYRKK